MTEKIKIAASILQEETEIVQLPKKIKFNDINFNIGSLTFAVSEEDLEEKNNIFFSILKQYQINAFDLFNLKEISKTLQIKIDFNNSIYDIDLLLYRIATNLNTSLLIQKKDYNNINEIKLHLSDLEQKFEFLMQEIEDINKKIYRIDKIKNKIINENIIIRQYIIETDHLSLEKLKLNKIEEQIFKKKNDILEIAKVINNYINKYLQTK